MPGHRIEVMPGASAPIMAVALSGIPADRFLFAGFLPAKSAEKRRALEELRSMPAALIFFEAPGRVTDTLEAIRTVLGDRRIVIARELTKLHEEVMRGYRAMSFSRGSHPARRSRVRSRLWSSRPRRTSRRPAAK